MTKVKEWFIFKIQGLTLNKSCSIVCVLQTLFKDPSLNLSLSLTNKGHKIDSAAVFSTYNFSKSGVSLSNDIDIPRSPNFAKQLELVQK